ncbi:iron-sulfur cluster carrier protein ApbC [Sinimarinibacterium sp. CAU 1509]|uniref:iron-sulfur cluster carrier protein ApbC n=1 Tax=Sinimarinibacterium sp. CAU 1509 TaxID=2562283 RepID=UPI0010AC7747|nr:iron-sulfur cluster carrier protein ApbC [Sinimarinibacterium sp. CAU 1509]TJY62893.1 iron-sulfur cluster carrier protein ApbC [Sinimarinibacterium sp. CAU 1509]
MAVTRETLLAALDGYVDPLIGQGLVTAGAVRRAEPSAEGARIDIELGFPAAGYRETLISAVRAVLREQLGIDAQVSVDWKITEHTVQKTLQTLPGIRNIIAVASGKGGVGKSTVAVNLALALVAEGARVGILDADIYGPSQPRMLGTSERPVSTDGKRMSPIRAHGLQAMSIGFLVDDDQPMIWRGPMVTQALAQLLGETAWDNLDYLIVDLPPGTGDIQLSLSQRIPVSGAVIVTTPQDIALLDARKGLQMFRKVEVPVLGVVENMAWHTCSNCGHHEAIFGEGGGARLAAQYGTELLGQLPLELSIREQADSGCPTVVADPESNSAQRYRAIARLATARLAYGVKAPEFPDIEVVDD